MRFVAGLGFHYVELESEIRTIICKLQTNKEDLSKLRAYIDEVQDLHGIFATCCFGFLSRTGNGAAHEMAQFGMTRTTDGFWVEEALVMVLEAADTDRRLMDLP